MPTLSLVHWLLMGNFVVLCGAAFFIIALRRQQARDTRDLEDKILRLEQGQEAVTRSAVGLGRRIKQVEVRTAKAEKAVPLAQQQDNRFEQASRLAGMGATVDDLIDSLGVARAEAELLVSMRRQSA